MTTEVYESLLDVREFARRLIGEPLWPHQSEVATSAARTRVMCCGRQAGKSRTLAVVALHGAFTHANYRVLILSAGEDAAHGLLGEISALASTPLLAGSVTDDNSSRVILSNGSTIRCVPASEKQVRGTSVDLLILDEAAQISDELWRAARYSIIARSESRVVMASTPFGSRDRFFAQAYTAGVNGAESYASFHWPSQVSPLIDDALLQDWRRTDPEWVYQQEVLAEWVDDQQAYFRAEELLEAVADYELWTPERVREHYEDGQLFGGAGGLDWGFANDTSALTLIAPLDDCGLNRDLVDGRQVFFLPLVEVAAVHTRYADWIRRVVDVSSAMKVRVWASETNGVGAMPSQEVEDRLRAADNWYSYVFPIQTDNRRKQSGYGAMKILLQGRRLVLPRHPELLKQLNALEFTYSQKTGQVQIAVPERAGHDDAADSAMQAVACLQTGTFSAPQHRGERPFEGEVITTTGGIRMPAIPLPLFNESAITRPPATASEVSQW